MAEKTPEEMREAVLAIREKMAAAAREAGRDPAEVQLCAACKTRTAETVAAQTLTQALTAASPAISSDTCRPTRSKKSWAGPA